MNLKVFFEYVLTMTSAVCGTQIVSRYTRLNNITPTVNAKYQAALTTRSKLECGAACTEESECRSFSFDKETRICSMSSGITDHTSGSVYYDTYCPSEAGYEYVEHLNLCYRIERDTGKNLRQIQQICQSEGAHLILIQDSTVFQFFIDLIYSRNLDDTERFYIDGNDEETEGVWKTCNGDTMTYFNWAGSNPNGGTDGNCLELLGMSGFLMSDTTCDDPAKYGGFICQIDVQLPA